MEKFRKSFCLFLAIMLVIPFGTAFVRAGTAEAEAYASDDHIIYQEDFDSVSGSVTLDSGNNMSGPAKGWIYAKKSDTGSVRIENGKMYISGYKYDVIYRDGGETWGNYTLEADFCYTSDNKGWGGMLYNVQSGTKFQKVGINPSNGSASANGYDGGWTNDSAENKWKMTNDPKLEIPQINRPFRMKVTVYNKTATFSYAMLNADGTMKTDFVELLSISNIPADAQTGSIGFMLPNKESEAASFWVDNIKCCSDTLVSYSENFDSYSDISLKGDADNADIGIYYEKNFSSGTATLTDGKLCLSGGGKNFDAIFFNMGKNWTNYAVEADIMYPAAESGWAGILYRSTDINNFQKAAASPGKRKCLNGQLGGSWYKDKEGVSKLDYPECEVALTVTNRLRIEANENSAKLYIAYYDQNTGNLGEWKFVMQISDNFADIHMSGTVGFIVGGSSNSKTSTIIVDNLTVSRIPGADRMATAPNAAEIYEPVTGIVNPPVAVEVIGDTLPLTEGERAAVVMAEVDANMNVLKKDGTVLTTAASFIDTCRSSLIPAFIIDSDAEATALAALIREKELIDCYVVADERNASLVEKVRLANETTALITGALIFDDLNSPDARKAARALVADSMSYVAISRAPLSEEAAYYFALRQVAAWSYANDAADVYRGIANGYHGIISTDASVIYDVYESITETAVSGKPVIIAHRGANENADVKYPENTLMGIRAAKEIYGADGIEIDFGLSKDGYAILMHDTTVDRTTNGTGNFSSFTLAELKALSVDYVSGKETTIPTLEEAIQLAIELDVVLYCHVKDKTDANIAVFSYLVDKYEAHDRVLLFVSAFEDYNPNTARTASSAAYKFKNQAVVTDGIVFSAGNQAILEGLTTHVEGVVAMKETITKYNYQPLFYQYSKQGAMWGEESFYYQLSARGFVNTHSITDGQANMDKTALTLSGAVGYLTNNIQFCDDYHYAIDLSGEKLTLNHGEKIDRKKTIRMIVGGAEVNCGIIQLGGSELVAADGSFTLNGDGTVTVVYYADRKADGGSTYRIYSEPVTISFDCIDHASAVQAKDDTYHWYECTCGEVFNKEQHTDSDKNGSCDICDQQMTVSTPGTESGQETSAVAGETASKGCASFASMTSLIVTLVITAMAVIFKKQ